jgi:DNA-binding NarL/FixJ family response regulator
MSNSYTIIVADDHPLFRVALTQAIGAQVEGANVLEAEHLKHLEHQMRNEIDLVLLDLHMPGSSDLFGFLHIEKIIEGNKPDELEDIMALCLENFPMSDINFVFNL